MGTRNLTCVVENNVYRVAQYCQWDGYPSGQGVTALAFARDKMVRSIFVPKLRALVEETEESSNAKWKEVGVDIVAKKGWVGFEEAKKFAAKWPQLDRDMGADVLAYIQEQPGGLEIVRQVEFARDSLFCEWAYVIDLDKNTFEVFGGFNKNPIPADDRFAGLGKDGEYYPVRLLRAWPLDALPTNDEFVTEIQTIEALKEVDEETSRKVDV